MKKLSNTEKNIFMNIEINGSIVKHHIVFMLPYQPNGKGKNDFPRQVNAANVISIPKTIVMQPLVGAAFIEVAISSNSQPGLDSFNRWAVFKPMDNGLGLSLTKLTCVVLPDTSLG